MFKVMTWNLENLFRVGAASGPKTQQVYDEKLEGLAGTINAQAPDVLSVQEVGEPEALDDLEKLLVGTWHRRVSSHPDHRGIRVAWLARPDIIASANIVEFPATLAAVQADDAGATSHEMGRGAVAITVNAASGQSVQLVTAHLKSKLLTFPGGRFAPKDEDERARFAAYALYRRAAEATTLRTWVTGALADDGQHMPLVLTGDLNDTAQAATTQLLLGPPGSEIGTRGFDTPDLGDAQRLWNLVSRMPVGKDYSRINEGRRELIDHIVVSAALVRPEGTIEAIIDDALPSVTSTPTLRLNEPSSDHAPVVATFPQL